MSTGVVETYAGATRMVNGRVPEDCRRVLLMCEYDPGCGALDPALVPAGAWSPGSRLMTKFGLPTHVYMALWRINLCHGVWSETDARAKVMQLVGPETPWDVFVLLGGRACRAAKYTDGPMSWRREWRTPRVWMTVPSPIRGKHWHDPGVVQDVRKMLTEVVPGVPWGGAVSER